MSVYQHDSPKPTPLILVNDEPQQFDHYEMFQDVIEITEPGDKARRYKAGHSYLVLEYNGEDYYWRVESHQVERPTDPTQPPILRVTSAPWVDPAPVPYQIARRWLKAARLVSPADKTL